MKFVVDGKEVEIPSGGGSSGVPSGFIGMWSGDTVPEGWALCDGQNGTPDLRGRFVLGASDNHEMGETGGAEEVTLTVEQMPKHSHRYGIYAPTKTVSSGNASFSVESSTTSITDNTGDSQPHPNMPPYYVLAYIMKL